MSAFFDPADYLDRSPQDAATKVEAGRLRRETGQRARLCHNMTKVAASSRMVATGLADMIASEVGEGRAARLQELLPRLVFTTLTPYLGGEEAAERARAAGGAQPR